MSQLVRALRFQMTAEEKYLASPTNLSALVNFAILNHTTKLDYDTAEQLYKEAYNRAPKHPIVLLCYAAFKLAVVEYPRPKSFTQAQDMIYQALQIDPTKKKFALVDECFFHWGVIVNSDKAQARANYAILHQILHADYDRAEALYRSAIKMDPQDTRISQNYEDLIKHRVPGGMYSKGGPPVAVKERSELVTDLVEYQKRRDPTPMSREAQYYWRNK